jgi:hypothetical protein
VKHNLSKTLMFVFVTLALQIHISDIKVGLCLI